MAVTRIEHLAKRSEARQNQMDVNLLQTLLHQTESDALDFKRDQYPFEGADNGVKSEILKDILAIANAWKSTDGYIVIGADERVGMAAKVVGVSEHLDDAKLQQFVNEKTNRVVKFSYAAIAVDDKQVGVVKIDASQARPIFLKRDFGKLKKNRVYIRRGSSTAEADPDEIALMGEHRVTKAASPMIDLEFYNPDTHERLGTEVSITSTLLVDPPPPRYASPAAVSAAMSAMMKQMAMNPPMASVLANLRLDPTVLGRAGEFGPAGKPDRAYRQTLALHAGLGFWVRNSGSVAAKDVRIVVRGTRFEDLSQLDETDHPKNCGEFGLRTVFRSAVTAQDHGNEWCVTIDVGKLQPGSETWIPDRWYVGARRPLQLDLEAVIFADNLPVPVSVPIVVEIRTAEKIYRPEDFEDHDDGRCAAVIRRVSRS